MDSSNSTPFRLIAAATVNNTLVRAGLTRLQSGVVCNTSATKYYLKLYDKATAPVAGTDVPIMTIQLLAGTNFNVYDAFSDEGVFFKLGLGFAITALPADADTTAVTAIADVIVNFGYFNG